MPKRVVDTNFWSNADVLDHYSLEDKYFYLYLITNCKTTQLGIYSLPKKVIAFEAGFNVEIVDVLLDRFVNTYKKIIYDSETQEIALIDSLRWSVLVDEEPAADLLSSELSQVKQSYLIQQTYEYMHHYWQTSSRPFDKIAMSLFEEEITRRKLVIENDSN